MRFHARGFRGGRREEVRQVDASDIDGAPAETTWPVAPEGAAQPSDARPGRRSGLQKEPGGSCKEFSVRIKTSACACISKTRRASGRRGACAISGGSGASDRRASSLSATRLPTSTRPSSPAPTTIATDEHVALVLDGAGWHSGKTLRVPGNITPVPLPPYSPELNPVERVWLYLKERFLSLRLHNDYTAIVAAAAKACLASLTAYPWIMRVKP